MAEIVEELKMLFTRVKEEHENTGLKINIKKKKKKKTKIMAFGPTFFPWQIEEGESRSCDRFYFLKLQN